MSNVLGRGELRRVLTGMARVGGGEPQPNDVLSFQLGGTAAWQEPNPGGVTDHGALTGLADDDHTQYQLESEKAAANGYASLDANTRVPSAQLGTGTPDGTTFLRGDRTWATPPGGGGGPTTTKKTADESTTSNTVLTSAAGLSFSVTAGRYYMFDFLVLFRTAATTTGIVLAVSAPAATRFGYTSDIPIAADGTAATRHGWGTASDDLNVGTGVQAANTDYVAYVRGIILPSANGTIQIRFRSEVSASSVTVRQGSAGILYDLGT